MVNGEQARRSESIRRGLAALRETLCVLAVLGVTLAAQEPTFTVASIKINNTGAQKKAESAGLASAGGVIEPPRGGRVVAQAATARVLIRYAYGELGSNGAIVRPLEAGRVLAGPDWIDDTMFDIDARMDNSSRGALERTAMMRGLLTDRFGLRAHRERQELPVYNLVFARADRKPGPQLHELTSPCAPLTDGTRQEVPCAVRTRPGSITGHGIAIAALATYLSPVAGRVVVDSTGLAGRFDVALTFGLPADLGIPDAKAAPTGDAPSIFVAIQQQLGLRLVAARGPVDVVVVDRIERPTEN